MLGRFLFFLLMLTLLAGSSQAAAPGRVHVKRIVPVKPKLLLDAGGHVPRMITWFDMTRSERYAEATRLTDELSDRLGLPADTDRAKVARLVNHLLGSYPQHFMADGAPGQPLSQLLRENVSAFQHTLAPILPETAYNRYVALLDELGVVAQ